MPWTRETPEDRERLWAECERLSGWHETPTTANARQIRRIRWPATPRQSTHPIPQARCSPTSAIFRRPRSGIRGRRSRTARRRAGRSGERVSARGRLPPPQDDAHLPHRRVRPAERSQLSRRELQRGLAGPDHLRALGRRHTNHLRRGARAEGSVQARRSAARARFQAGRRSRPRGYAKDTPSRAAGFRERQACLRARTQTAARAAGRSGHSSSTPKLATSRRSRRPGWASR